MGVDNGFYVVSLICFFQIANPGQHFDQLYVHVTNVGGEFFDLFCMGARESGCFRKFWNAAFLEFADSLFEVGVVGLHRFDVSHSLKCLKHVLFEQLFEYGLLHCVLHKHVGRRFVCGRSTCVLHSEVWERFGSF